MIDLYFSGTPNGFKLKLFLEETGIPYTLKPLRLGKGEQHAEEYRRISANGKMPALVDHAPADGGPPLSMFESGAMLLYLAEKHGVLLSKELRARAETIQWLFWQMAGLGPMGGQAGHFRSHAPEEIAYAVARYTREVERLFGVLDRQLAGREFIAGEFSIADIACYPWVVPYRNLGQELSRFPNLQRWFESIAARPATQRVYEGAEEMYPPRAARAALDAEARQALFGQSLSVLVSEASRMPWVPLSPGKSFKPLRFLRDDRGFVELLRMEPGTGLPTHRHTGEVHVYNLEGSRRLQGGELTEAGDYVYEPAGTVDSWTVEGATPMTALVVVMGAVEYLDAQGRVVSTYTASKLEEIYRAHCEHVGVPCVDLRA